MISDRHLKPDAIVKTIELLGKRIQERFPQAGLNGVCRDLLEVAQGAQSRSRKIGRAILSVRLLSALLILIIAAGFAYAVNLIRIPNQPLQATEFIQVFEAGFNAVVLIGATILFLMTLESRVKRARALRAIHEIRSLVHIIDMHQLTKDPEKVLIRDRSGLDTASSPKTNMTAYQLNRYLDYCTEMLALCSKVAALYVEYFPDPDAVGAVNDLETLTTGMSRKIWQKIMLLHRDGFEETVISQRTTELLTPAPAAKPAESS